MRLYDGLIPGRRRPRGFAPSAWRIVDPTCRERRTSRNPPDRQGHAPDDPAFSDRLGRVGRAARMETTPTTHDAAQGPRIDPDEREKAGPDGRRTEPNRPAHTPSHDSMTLAAAKARSKSDITSCIFDPRISGRATATTSQFLRIRGASARQASLSSRRARFRATAPPTVRELTKPTRDKSSESST